MSRDVPFEPQTKCDDCGKTGAFDFMGDYFCALCANKRLAPELATQQVVGQWPEGNSQKK